MLLILQTLGKHPLLEIAIKYQALGVAFGEKLRDEFVLLEEHHRVTRQLEPPD